MSHYIAHVIVYQQDNNFQKLSLATPTLTPPPSGERCYSPIFNYILHVCRSCYCTAPFAATTTATLTMHIADNKESMFPMTIFGQISFEWWKNFFTFLFLSHLLSSLPPSLSSSRFLSFPTILSLSQLSLTYSHYFFLSLVYTIHSHLLYLTAYTLLYLSLPLS